MREDTLRNLGHFSAVLLFLFLLLILSLVSANFTFASSQITEGQFPQSIIAASSTDSTPHALELRAIQDGDNAEPRKVSQFKLDMTNVVTAQVNSQVLIFVTDSSVRVLEAKVRTVSDQLIDLVPLTTTQANAFSLANLPVGVYTLDIISQKGNAKAAYEGILVISQQPTTIINETTKQIINQEINQNTRVDIDTKIIFKGKDKSKPPSPGPEPIICPQYIFYGKGPCAYDYIPPDENGKCPDGHEYVDEDTGCVPEWFLNPLPPTTPPGEDKECIEDKGYSLSKGSYIDNNGAIVGSPCDPVEFCSDPTSTDPTVIDHCQDIWTDTDDCPDEKPGDECYDEWDTPGKGTCLELYGKICCNDPAFSGEGECYDEGDLDDCEEGFIDKGFGCVPIEEEGEKEPCTPDGPPCPPCPEGVEAGWCEDEDERQDFDCRDEGMENDPRCKDGEPVNVSEEEEVEEEENETTEEVEEIEEESEEETEEVSTEEE